MRVLLVNSGDFSQKWCNILLQTVDIDLAIVNKEGAEEQDVPAEITCYPSLSAAIEQTEWDFLVNATSLSLHSHVDRTAFSAGVPVLSEGPIAENYKQAQDLVAEANAQSVLFQIAESYRQFPIIRAVRDHLKQGKIGELKTIQVEFRKTLSAEELDFNQRHPLLRGISRHHFDLIRYLSGGEGEKIFAQSFSPKGNWLAGNSNLSAFIELDSNVVVNYSGTLVSEETETSWIGTWKLEGKEGMIILRDHKLCLIKNGEVWEIGEFKAESNLASCLDNFICSLTEGKDFGTEAEDYLQTQRLVKLARHSSDQGKLLSISDL